MVKYVVWIVAIGVLLLFFVLPLATTYAIQSGFSFKTMARWLDAIQWLQTFVMHAFVYLWITFVGSCFASFLNVVAWRVPRGRSILGSSHCPHCDSRLSLKDNVPVFGWLNNDGKCRTCHAPIAVRYLVVELLLGVTFFLLFLVGVVWGGVNLPLRPDLHRVGIEFVLFTPNWFLILTFVYHATLMCGLFTVAVIASEGKSIPVTVFFFASIFLIAIASTWSWVIQVPWTAGIVMTADWPPVAFSQSSLWTMGIGLAAGVLVGGIMFALIKIASRKYREAQSGDPDSNASNQTSDQRLNPRLEPTSGQTSDQSLDPMLEPSVSNLSAVVSSMALVGLALGWQSAVWVFAISMAIGGGMTITRRSAKTEMLRPVAANASAIVMFATIVHMLFWRWQMPVQLWLTTL